MSAWLLPDHIADVLPSEARHIEELRRLLLDTARGYGYELVIPPLVEHLESLLTGTGEALGLQTFKLVDQLSGRSLGVRADTTPQVARIDAHLLGRGAVTRLCYCGPVLHTRPERPHATREPLQLGAEIYGYAGREADLEILALALDCLRAAPVADPRVDLADARIVRALLAEVPVDNGALADIHQALAAKDASGLAEASAHLPALVRERLQALVDLYGGPEVLQQAERRLGSLPEVAAALADLKWLIHHLEGVRIGFDLADARGWGYYSGTRFAIYADGAGDALLRGGRYDGVGAVFGHKRDRRRPAVGFSLDLKQLVHVAAPRPLRAAVRAPWGDAPGLAAAVAALRRQGETVVRVLPGQEAELDEFDCDRELVPHGERWAVVAL
ncbi:MAG TPA: ATP phosphoribosyltransferase regulatory subunit [Ottowia sp.]|uniref:ATP phosphoribosyltransferase regulatory subunit n=1 Tax=Ottowia sp. TaxID=1898956 RepID=UPI002C725325|nr:ATP phosphoribosyltransferase regulatory subunit [Ottowia sp.]HMN21452.1 ATP phosphoribosyltransferase regulatory subunit [Ottowia sp.]